MGITVSIRDIKRAPTGNVSGELTLIWKEDVPTMGEVQLINVGRKFDIPKNGRQEIIDESFDVKAVKVTAKVSVFEKAGAEQVCVQGRVEGKALGIFDVGHDLDENCHPIPAAS